MALLQTVLARAGIPSNGLAHTPSDTVLLPAGTVAVYALGAGTLVLEGQNGVSFTVTVEAKSIFPFAGARVKAASTATGLVALTE
jgi:hypothetical protein